MGRRRKIVPNEVRPMEVLFIQVKIGTQQLRFTLPELKQLQRMIGKLRLAQLVTDDK